MPHVAFQPRFCLPLLIAALSATPAMAQDTAASIENELLQQLQSAPSRSTDLSVTIDQSGRNNAVDVRQIGDRLEADVLQSGEDNRADLLQLGEDNVSVVDQTGSGDWVDIRQYGTGGRVDYSADTVNPAPLSQPLIIDQGPGGPDVTINR